MVPRHSIKGYFNWDGIETPMFDSLVRYQLGDGDVYTYFLAFVGRLFCPTARTAKLRHQRYRA